MTSNELGPVDNKNAAALPMPIEQRDDSETIENVYPQSDGVTPDTASVIVAEEYLESRLVADPKKSQQVVLRSVGLPPYPVRVPNGEKVVSVRQATHEWRVHPKVAATVTLGSFALVNILANTEAIEDAGKVAGHAVYRLFNPLEEKVETHHTPGHSETITVDAVSPNKVDIAEVDRDAVEKFAQTLETKQKEGGIVKSIEATGNTSDEAGSDASLCEISAYNTDLGVRRVTITADTLQEVMGEKLPVKDIKKTTKEHVLDVSDCVDLTMAAQAEGFPQVVDAIAAVDIGRATSPGLATKIKNFFTSKRKGTLTATVEMPGKPIEVKVPVKEVDNAPEMPDVDWVPFAIPLLPWRRRERVDELRPQRRWALKPGKRFFLKPKVIDKDLNTAWVRLRPEALQMDGTLVKSPWAYTRKYEALLREDRIKNVLRADWQAKDGDPDTEKSLRIMFVDHTPAKETIEAFEGLLKQFAHMQGGSLGDKISGIFVYPSKNAGLEHGDPKKIGLGVDKQDDKNTLGFNIPLLELIEMHMDTELTPDELVKQLGQFMGPSWTLAHEAAGHATEITDEKLTLEPVRARGIDNAHVPRGTSFVDRDHTIGDMPSIKERREEEHPLQFDIEYTVMDANGTPVTLRTRVPEGDPRLSFASQSQIVHTRHTHYAGSKGEHYAEVAASVTTGINIDYSHAGIDHKTRVIADNGMPAKVHDKGYAPDKHAQRTFIRSVGADRHSYPATFADQLDVKVTLLDKPEDDALMREHLVRARNQAFARQKDTIAVLSEVVQD